MALQNSSSLSSKSTEVPSSSSSSTSQSAVSNSSSSSSNSSNSNSSSNSSNSSSNSSNSSSNSSNSSNSSSNSSNSSSSNSNSITTTSSTSRGVLDGSKVVLCLIGEERVLVDSPSRILVTTSNVKLEQLSAWQTCASPSIEGRRDMESVVVVDSSSLGYRYFPIILEDFGVLYTKDGASHVVVGDVHRSKVTCRVLPCRACNRFEISRRLQGNRSASSGGGARSMRGIDESAYRGRGRSSSSDYDSSSSEGSFSNDDSTSSSSEEEGRNEKTAIVAKTENVEDYRREEESKLLSRFPAELPNISCAVFLRSDESLVRYHLKSKDQIDVQAGKVVAWTVGISFEFRNFCCFRFVTAVRGNPEGTVWIHNPRPRNIHHPPPLA